MSPPSWAYDVDNFDPPPDDELVCSICLCVFCDPVQSVCNHVFCRKCIVMWLEKTRHCPICRKKPTNFSLQDVLPLVQNMIMNLTLRCHNVDRGCKEKLTLEGCELHLRECVYEMIQCTNQSCKQMVLRKDVGHHELHNCSHRRIKCKTCHFKHAINGINGQDCIDAIRQFLIGTSQVYGNYGNSNMRKNAGLMQSRNSNMLPTHFNHQSLEKPQQGTGSTIMESNTIYSQQRKLMFESKRWGAGPSLPIYSSQMEHNIGNTYNEQSKLQSMWVVPRESPIDDSMQQQQQQQKQGARFASHLQFNPITQQQVRMDVAPMNLNNQTAPCPQHQAVTSTTDMIYNYERSPTP